MGLLPVVDLANTPWYKVAINLIEPWSKKTRNSSGEFYALTCIDVH